MGKPPGDRMVGQPVAVLAILSNPPVLRARPTLLWRQMAVAPSDAKGRGHVNTYAISFEHRRQSRPIFNVRAHELETKSREGVGVGSGSRARYQCGNCESTSQSAQWAEDPAKTLGSQ